jgi:hypothetical protein
MEVCETPPRGDAASESVSRIPAPDRPGEAPHTAGNCGVLRTLGGIADRVSHGRNGATETSEGSKAQGGSGALPPATGATRTGPVHGAKPRSCRNSKGATATATWCGCGEGASSEGYETASRGRSHTARVTAGNGSVSTGDGAVHWQRWSRVGTARNAANPQIGSRMQQACDRRAEKTVEVVRNHEGGTGLSRLAPRRPKSDRKVRREWTRSGMSMEG